MLALIQYCVLQVVCIARIGATLSAALQMADRL